MVRPRLVEEGKPLDSLNVSDDDPPSDHEMEMDDRQLAAASRRTATTLPVSFDMSAPSSSQSSLQRAMGDQSYAPKRSMRVTIGGRDHRSYHKFPPEELPRTAASAGMALPVTSHWTNHDHLPTHQLSPAAHHQPTLPQHSYDNRHYHPTSQQQHTPAPPCRRSSPYTPPSSVTQTHYEVGADYRPTSRMEGVEDHSLPLPLVVIDGANVAYAYSHARQEHVHQAGKMEPDVRGLSVACSYFRSLRARVVLPASFVRAKPRPTDPSRPNAFYETDRFEILQQLSQQGKLVTSPPTDDDDAYALTIAQRENLRARQTRQGQAPAFVLSNDLFRDAQDRDASGELKEWLVKGDRPETGPGRISYTFVDLGLKDDYGDPIFDIVPNPRHPLIAWVEDNARKQANATV
jgi:hypothetical protein